MSSSKISSRFQILIPKEIRKSMRLKPGEEVEIMEIGGVIEIVRIRPLNELRGKLKGIDTSRYRDDDRI